ncbi:MAG: DUF6090 family protein [Bacteroidota bacterium]
MIKFFRKIRQKLLSENKFSKYLIYAVGEIVLVVIGILIALQINNWNENRKNKVLELSILKEFKSSISMDIVQLNSRAESAKNNIYSANILLNHLEKNLGYNDSLNKHFNIITSTLYKAFNPQITAYKMLESKGVDLISNIELKKDILNLYNFDYHELIYEYENYQKNILNYGRPIARSQFEVTDNNSTTPGLKPVNYNSLSLNVQLVNTLKIIVSNDKGIQEVIESLTDKCQKIVAEIDIELNK